VRGRGGKRGREGEEEVGAGGEGGREEEGGEGVLLFIIYCILVYSLFLDY